METHTTIGSAHQNVGRTLSIQVSRREIPVWSNHSDQLKDTITIATRLS